MIRYKASLKNDETGIKFLVGVLEYAERIGYDYILWDWLVIDNTYDYFQIGTSHFLAENRIPPHGSLIGRRYPLRPFFV